MAGDVIHSGPLGVADYHSALGGNGTPCGVVKLRIALRSQAQRKASRPLGAHFSSPCRARIRPAMAAKKPVKSAESKSHIPSEIRKHAVRRMPVVIAWRSM